MKIDIDCKSFAKLIQYLEYATVVIIWILCIGKGIGTEIEPMDPIELTWTIMLLFMATLWLVLGRLRHSFENIGDKEDAEE